MSVQARERWATIDDADCRVSFTAFWRRVLVFPRTRDLDYPVIPDVLGLGASVNAGSF